MLVGTVDVVLMMVGVILVGESGVVVVSGDSGCAADAVNIGSGKWRSGSYL